MHPKNEAHKYGTPGEGQNQKANSANASRKADGS